MSCISAVIGQVNLIDLFIDLFSLSFLSFQDERLWDQYPTFDICMLSYHNLFYIKNNEIYCKYSNYFSVVCNSCPCLCELVGKMKLVDQFIHLLKALLAVGNSTT